MSRKTIILPGEPEIRFDVVSANGTLIVQKYIGNAISSHMSIPSPTAAAEVAEAILTTVQNMVNGR